MTQSSKTYALVVTRKTFCAAALFLGLSVTPALAYEVWMGTHLMESSVASSLDDWDLTASLLDGVNINRAPDDTNPASNPEWQTIIAQVNHVGTTMVEIARPEVSRNPDIVDDDLIPKLSQELDQKLQGARNYGYEIDHIMIYDERIDGTLFEWTQTEIEHLRDQLDAKGQQDIGLIWRSTNNAQRNRNFSALPIIDHALIEASADALLNNTNNQITLLNWLWTNPATANKDVILQIPRSNNSMTQYAATRRVVVKLGQELGFENGMQSDRLVFLPVTYNDNVDYLPETIAGGTAYTDTITSLALSLIEQRPLFEGISGTPTNADADSFVREIILPTYGTLLAGWDTFSGGGASPVSAATTTAGVTASLVTTSEGSNWHTADGRGASADGDWGTFAGPPTASTVAGDGVTGENLELPNATTGGTITFTLTNNGTSDIELDGFHFDSYAFRPKAARAYELSVSSGDLTNGVIYTSADDEITSVAGAWNNLAHDDISHSLSGLADNTLEAGGSVDFLLTFSGGEGDSSGGHDLWVDNVAITGTVDIIPGDFDADGDVDGADFLAWQRNDGTPAGLTAWENNYGAPSLLAASATTVPEPSSIALVILAVRTLFTENRLRQGLFSRAAVN